MENASKALIIAGAILLSILIIGLGMVIFQQAKGAITGTNLDPQKIEAYNSQFYNYEGTNSGVEARALYNLIRSHNNANVDDTSLQIKLTIGDTEYDENSDVPALEEAAQLPANTLKAANTYNITFAVDKRSGFITACNIKKVTKTPAKQ